MATCAWGKEESFWSALEKELCGIKEDAHPVAPISATRNGNVTLAGNGASLKKKAQCTLSDRNKNKKCQSLCSRCGKHTQYVLNTRTLSASTVIILILLLPLSLFLFSFVFICKCFWDLCCYSCIFASGLVVCFGGYLCETHKRNQLVTLKDYYDRVLLISFFNAVYFLWTTKTLIIGYGFNNITIKIAIFWSLRPRSTPGATFWGNWPTQNGDARLIPSEHQPWPCAIQLLNMHVLYGQDPYMPTN